MFFEKVDWLVQYEYVTSKSDIVPGSRIRAFTTSNGDFIWNNVIVINIDGNNMDFKFSEMYMSDSIYDPHLTDDRIIKCRLEDFEIL